MAITWPSKPRECSSPFIEWVDQNKPQAVALLATACAVLLRAWLIFTHDGYLGVDGGAYLLGLNALLGDEPTGTAFPRPPLAPGWLLYPFTQLWGIEWGYKVWSLAFSFIPLLPAFALLAWRTLSPWQAAAAISFFAFDLLTSEMMVTGSLPLIGLGLFLLMLWAMGNTPRRLTWPFGCVLTLSIGLTPFINQTSAGLVAIALPIYLGILFFTIQRAKPTFMAWPHPWLWPGVRRLLPYLVCGSILGLLALPWYLDVAPGSRLMHFPGPWVYPSKWQQSAWIQMGLALGFGYGVIRHASPPMLKGIGGLTILFGLLAPWLSNDETVINIFYRSRYWVMPFLTISIVWVISHLWWAWLMRWYKRLTLAGVAGLLALMPFGFTFQFRNQDNYSSFMRPAMIEVASYLPPGRDYGVISNGFMFSTWVAALYKVPVAWTFTTQPPLQYQAQYEQTQCIMGWRTDCEPLEAARLIGMDYILIDVRYPWLNHEIKYYGSPQAVWSTIETAPWLTLIAEKDTARLYRIGD